MRLLLDGHLAPELARQLQRHGIDAVALQDWQEGAFRAASDEEILEAAAGDGRVLVTYDLRTIRPLVERWAETGRPHAGVNFVDDKSIRPNDIGRLVRAMLALNARHGHEPWHNRTAFLRAELPTS